LQLVVEEEDLVIVALQDPQFMVILVVQVVEADIMVPLVVNTQIMVELEMRHQHLPIQEIVVKRAVYLIRVQVVMVVMVRGVSVVVAVVALVKTVAALLNPLDMDKVVMEYQYHLSLLQ